VSILRFLAGIGTNLEKGFRDKDVVFRGDGGAAVDSSAFLLLSLLSSGVLLSH
jgi:hypothetical protein